ncbi:MAG: monovalent cation/H+ antiporter subunit A [Xanthomonadales bacterium]|nr:monovalent cation/H+ antiporter subunit A [Xanthomonadales bacterium]
MLEALLATPFVTAILVALARHASRTRIAQIASLAPLLGLLMLALITPQIMAGEVVRSTLPWIPQAGLALSLRIDGLAWMFAGLVLGIGGLIVMYAHYYLDRNDSAARFFAYLLLFMGAMLGMVISGNLILLVVFWELTSLSSFLLIGFWHSRDDAREGAKMALVITGAGGLALLGGVLLIGRIVGSYELDVVLNAGPQILANPLYPAVLGLVLLAVFTKSAQFPFHFWLPHAMAAPTPVSAYLHSATMVKAGVFLLARLHPALAGSDLFFYVVSGVGAITLLIGAWNAIFQHDLKGLLAYSTISHLGLITLLFGLSTPMAVVAGLFHILNHATFKASLFMAAGIIDHETGTRDMRRMGGLWKLMPHTAVLAIVAALAMAGIPLLNGFLSKEMFFAEALEMQGHPVFRIAITSAALLAAIMGVAYSLRFVHDTFFGRGPRALEEEPHPIPRWMRIPVEVLALLCLAVGIVPALLIAPALNIAAFGVLGDRLPEYSLAIWHGLSMPLLMSLAGVVGGMLMYFGLRRLFDLHGMVQTSFGQRIYRWKINRIIGISVALRARLENGSLQRYLGLLVLAALILGAAPFLGAHSLSPLRAGQPLPMLGVLLWVIGVVATVATVWFHQQRLSALVVIGVVGLAVSLSFVLLSAPDLALTQLLVEMITIAMMLLALNYLPQHAPLRPEPLPRRLRDGVIALLAGTGVATLVYAILTRPLDTVAGEMLARSLSEGGGSNVVNVILVDFRGFDTLGEITVFGIAGLIVHALLRQVRLRRDEVIAGPPPRMVIPTVVAQLLLPLAVAVSIYFFLRGHNLPGGGFIAGLVLAVPLLLQYLVSGSQRVDHRLGLNYTAFIGMGLIAALLTGVGSFILGYPFMTSAHGHPYLPVLGEIPLASAMAFDIGVYLVVFGSALLMLSMLGHIRNPASGPTPHEEAT